MNVKSEVLEDIIGTLGARNFLPFCIFEEELNAGLELRIEPAQLAVHHRYYLVVVLQAQKNVFEAGQ